MAAGSCPHDGFQWDGLPEGYIDTLAQTNTYVTGHNPDKAILLIHDLLSWTFPNLCLLADYYAREANATVFVPEFIREKGLPFQNQIGGSGQAVDPKMIHPCKIYEARILEFAKLLRARFRKLGAVGFCFGGWAVFRLGSKTNRPPLVDCITAGHPSSLTKKDIDEIGVPVQILSPEFDLSYTDELKTYSLETVPKLGVPFEYQHFAGVEHACFIRADPEIPGEWEAGERGKAAAVSWLRRFLDE
ncbi:hydrolase tropI [Hyphodiscus hymeniophilus]|uniref:Hydrolase tropI n=1 Tax=Hyphodiscus hymeniophilus TaxID=353542 RepID=A0A9P7AYX2_9HELO|nr:hydrolase tropI [Hyphodiscus hymeniophilus]